MLWIPFIGFGLLVAAVYGYALWLGGRDDLPK